MKWIVALLLYSLIPLQSARADEISLNIGKHNIRAIIASTPQSRERGMMHQASLCKNCGMLFVFPRAGKHNFWMKDTPMPLSIAFIAENGSILNIAEMQANTMQIYQAQGNALYALEMNQGWFSGHMIKAKDHVEGLQKAPRGQ